MLPVILMHALLRQPSLGNKMSSIIDNLTDTHNDTLSLHDVSDVLEVGRFNGAAQDSNSDVATAFSQDMQSEADAQHAATRKEEWEAQRNQYHQFAAQLRVLCHQTCFMFHEQ